MHCGSGFWGGQRPSLAHYVTGMGLWQRLLGRPASESGTLRHGDGAHGRSDRCRRAFVLPTLLPRMPWPRARRRPGWRRCWGMRAPRCCSACTRATSRTGRAGTAARSCTGWRGRSRSRNLRRRPLRYSRNTPVEDERFRLDLAGRCLTDQWCRRGDSNPHGLPHTPLKRARLPIPPLRRSKQKVCRRPVSLSMTREAPLANGRGAGSVPRVTGAAADPARRGCPPP